MGPHSDSVGTHESRNNPNAWTYHPLKFSINPHQGQYVWVYFLLVPEFIFWRCSCRGFRHDMGVRRGPGMTVWAGCDDTWPRARVCDLRTRAPSRIRDGDEGMWADGEGMWSTPDLLTLLLDQSSLHPSHRHNHLTKHLLLLLPAPGLRGPHSSSWPFIFCSVCTGDAAAACLHVTV